MLNKIRYNKIINLGTLDIYTHILQNCNTTFYTIFLYNFFIQFFIQFFIKEKLRTWTSERTCELNGNGHI